MCIECVFDLQKNQYINFFRRFFFFNFYSHLPIYFFFVFFFNSEILFQTLQSTKNTKITNLLTILPSPSPNKNKKLVNHTKRKKKEKEKKLTRTTK